MIKSLLEKDLTLDDILFTLWFTKGSPEENLVKNYLTQIIGELKPIPNNLTKLFIKIEGNKLQWYHYSAKEITGKKYFALLIMGEKC